MIVIRNFHNVHKMCILAILVTFISNLKMDLMRPVASLSSSLLMIKFVSQILTRVN